MIEECLEDRGLMMSGQEVGAHDEMEEVVVEEACDGRGAMKREEDCEP